MSKPPLFTRAKARLAKKYVPFGDSDVLETESGTTSCVSCGLGRNKSKENSNKIPNYHIVVVGDKDVLGKNELVLQYVYGEINHTSEDCDEFDPEVESVYNLCRDVNKEQVMLSIESWDLNLPSSMPTAEEREANKRTMITPDGIGGLAEKDTFPDGFVLIYSVTSVESFERIPQIHSHIISLAQKHRQIHSLIIPTEDTSDFNFHMPPFLLVANNVGPIFIRKVSSADGKAMASQLGIEYIEACPKSPPMNVAEVRCNPSSGYGDHVCCLFVGS